MNRSRLDSRSRIVPKGRPDSSHGQGQRGLACLLTTLHPERALSLALVKNLSEEMPDISFTLQEHPGIDVVWLCGYELGSARVVRALRARHPNAVLVVTGKETDDLWVGEVLGCGADCALSWPVDYARLSEVLHRRILQQRA